MIEILEGLLASAVAQAALGHKPGAWPAWRHVVAHGVTKGWYR